MEEGVFVGGRFSIREEGERDEGNEFEEREYNSQHTDKFVWFFFEHGWIIRVCIWIPAAVAQAEDGGDEDE